MLHVGSGQPFPTVADGLSEVTSMTWSDAVLVLHEGASFNEVASLDTGAVAFVNAPSEMPQWIYSSMPATPTLTVTGADTRVYIQGILLRGNGNDVGLSCNGARVDVRRARIVQNTGGGIVASNSCQLYVENSFLGGSENGVGAVDVNSASASVLYSSLTSGFAGATALACTTPISVTVRNSILLVGADSDAVACDQATISTSATEDIVGNFNGTQAWFTDYAVGDLSLAPVGAVAFGNTAQWIDGDPSIDIDGDPRPAGDSGLDYAGADVP
ncbi:MAG: hypothetical protein K0V04_28245 [Deltaproteobacteria bacterium]|nr:hypothetical protein [Deltaproteobacteria bacterium]